MSKWWSPSGLCFYDSNVCATSQMPSDKVQLTDTEYNNLMSKQAEGYRIEHNSSTGKPQAVAQGLTAATATTHEVTKATGSVLGHVTLSDSTSSTSGASAGVAATPKAVKAVADAKAPNDHSSTATTYGVGNGTTYGHLKLSDSTSSTSGVSGGVAATPAAVKAVQDAVTELDEKVVHTTGAETVAGVKTFTSTPRISGTNPEIHLQRTDIAKGTTPSAAASHSVGLHDKNGVDIANTFSAVQFTLDTDGNTKAELYAFKNTASSTDSAKIGITHPASGDPYTYAPTPTSTSDDSTKIATTAWVRDATGDTALNSATATKLKTSRTIRTNLASTSTASFDGSGNITPGVTGVLPVANGGTGSNTEKYLPLAGGTMTGNITGNRDEFTILKKDDAGSTVIRGGSAYASGASLILFGKNDENAGIARLVAHDGTNNNNLLLYPDGKATVGGSNIITAAGGQMEGPLRANTEGFVTGVADDDSVRMSGGTGWDNGASIVVYGKSHASYPGAFRVKAEDGTNEAVLIGKPDGTLTWGGQKVDTFPSGTKMLFNQAAAPTGWTKQTSVNDAALRVVSGTTGGGTGGSIAFSTLFATGKTVSLSGNVGATTLTVNQMPSHSHTQVVTADMTGYALGVQFVSNSRATQYANNTSSVGGSSSHTHALSGTATIALDVKYTNVIICAKA